MSREEACKLFVQQQFYAHEQTLGNLKRIRLWFTNHPREYHPPPELTECIAIMTTAIESLEECTLRTNLADFIVQRTERRREQDRNGYQTAAVVETKAERKARIEKEKDANQQ